MVWKGYGGMKIKELINLLIDKMLWEGTDVNVRIYDNYCGEYREITSIGDKKYSDFIIELGEDVDV